MAQFWTQRRQRQEARDPRELNHGRRCAAHLRQPNRRPERHPVRPMIMLVMPGMPERRTHDYHHNGITSLFATFNI